jgi:hypothetical protein
MGEWVPLEVKSISPSSGSRDGGAPALVWFASSEFDGNGAGLVEIGSVQTPVLSILGPFPPCLWAFSITTPALAPGIHAVRVLLPHGEEDRLEKAYGAVPNSLGLFASSAIFGHSSPTRMAEGDFDGDGSVDLAFSFGNPTSQDQVAIRSNGGTGSLSSLGVVDGVENILLMASEDLNADGMADLCLVAGNGVSPPRIRIYHTSPPLPSPVEDFAVGAQPASMVLHDVDGLAGPDVIVASAAGLDVTTFLNDGSGSFAFHGSTALANAPSSMAAGRFDTDHLADLVISETAADRMVMLAGTGGGSFSPPVPAGPGAGPTQLDSGDLTGDGLPDLVVALAGPPAFQIMANDGSGGMIPLSQFPVTSAPTRVRLLDFDVDGNLDILVLYGPSLDIFCGDGTGALIPGRQVHLDFSASLADVSILDLNGDGLPEILCSEPSTNLVWICVNTSN